MVKNVDTVFSTVVQVIGSGVAALCCAKLLSDKGYPVVYRGRQSRARPVLLIDSVTAGLIGDIIGSRLPSLERAHRIRWRRVRWIRRDAVGVRVPVDGCVVDGNRLGKELAERIQSRPGTALSFEFGDQPSTSTFGPSATWTVLAGGRHASIPNLLGETRCVRSGVRRALTTTVRLNRTTDCDTCVLEALGEGWMFLLPTAADRGIVQAIVPKAPTNESGLIDRLLDLSSFIGKAVVEVDGKCQCFDASPQFNQPPANPRIIAVGESAIAFDPLCGDGTGQAIRSAILAAAVVDAASRGEPKDDCVEHYCWRLARSFEAHLKACHHFYSSSSHGEIWKNEIDMTRHALTLLGPQWRESGRNSRPYYRLEGFRLRPTAV